MVRPKHTAQHPQQLARARSETQTIDTWGRLLVILILVLWTSSFLIGFAPAVSVLTIIGFSAAIVGLRKPEVGLLGVGMLSTIDPVTRYLLLTGGLLRWNTFNYWLLIVMVLYLPFLLRLNDIHTRSLQLLLLLLTIEISISPSWVLGAEEVLSAAALFGLLVYFARAQHDERNWYWLAVVNSVVAAAGGLAFLLQEHSLPYVNPNIWAFFPLTAMFTVCMAFVRVRLRRREITLLMALAAMNGLWAFLSASRGGMLIAGWCLLFLIVLIRSMIHRIFIILVGLLIGVVILTQFTDMQAHAVDRLDVLFNSQASLRRRTSGRSELLYGGWYMFQEHPMGVGTGGFPKTWANLPIVEGIGNYGRGEEVPAHATWIKILAENGVLGGVLLTIYVCSFVVVGWRRNDRKMLALGLLTTVVLATAFTVVEFQWAKGLWYFGAGVIVLLHRKRVATHLSGALQHEPIDNIVRSGSVEHG